MPQFGRVITAMVTPFNERGKVDFKQARKLALALLDSGNDGLVVAGTTGECSTLTDDEQIRLFAEIKEAVGDRGTLIAGTGSNSTQEAIGMTAEAEKLGYDAALLVVPYYNKPTQEGLYQHFKAVANSTRLPLILYNVPSRTVTNLAAETTIRLSKIKNIAGVKDASGNLEQTAKIIENTAKDFIVYSGNDGDTFPIVAMGGYGVIGVVTHLVGKQVNQMVNNLLTGKMAKAAEIHHRLLPLVNSMFVISNPIPIKYALNHIGFRVGKPRLPLVEPDDKSAAAIEATLKQYEPYIELR